MRTPCGQCVQRGDAKGILEIRRLCSLNPSHMYGCCLEGGVSPGRSSSNTLSLQPNMKMGNIVDFDLENPIKEESALKEVTSGRHCLMWSWTTHHPLKQPGCDPRTNHPKGG